MEKFCYNGLEISMKLKKRFPILFEGSFIGVVFYVKNVGEDKKKDIEIPYKFRKPIYWTYGERKIEIPELKPGETISEHLDFHLENSGYHDFRIPLNDEFHVLCGFNVYSKATLYVTLVGALLGSFLAYLLMGIVLP